MSVEAIYNEAIDRIRDERAKAAAGSGAAAVGDFMTWLLPRVDGLSEAVLQDGKTLAGGYEALRKYAEKHKVGSFYGMPPEQAAELLCKYYGVEADAARLAEAEAPAKAPAAAAPTAAAALTVAAAPAADALDALLEGL